MLELIQTKMTSDTETESISSYSSINSYVEVRTRGNRRLRILFLGVVSFGAVATVLSVPAMLPKASIEFASTTSPDTTEAETQKSTLFEKTTGILKTERMTSTVSVRTTETADYSGTTAYLSTEKPPGNKETTKTAQMISSTSLPSNTTSNLPLESSFTTSETMILTTATKASTASATTIETQTTEYYGTKTLESILNTTQVSVDTTTKIEKSGWDSPKNENCTSIWHRSAIDPTSILHRFDPNS